MIKDSKIIGTKIAAPYGWKKFKVGELFDMHAPSGNGMYSSADGSKSNKTGFIRCTTSSRDHNGVPICLPKIAFTEILKRGISVASNGDAGSVFYHSSEFAVLQDSYGLTLKVESNFFVSDLAYLFLCSVLNKQNCLFSYTTKAIWSRYCVLEIELPITSSDKLDFEWMEQYMKLVREDYLQQKKLSNQSEIKAYLTESQTDSLEITDADREFLREFDKLPRRKFKVGELFEKLSSKYLSTGNKFEHVYKTCTINHNIPMLYAKYDNNGIMYWSKYGEFETHKNCIGIIYNGAVSAGCVFAQEQSTGVLAESYLIKFSTQDVPFKVNLYFSSVLRKILSQKYSREYLATWNKVIDDELELPVRPDSQVDVASIEKYMQIQVKPLINNVAETLTSVGETN